MWKIKTSCRACGGTDLAEVFKFPHSMPLANAFRTVTEDQEGYAPCTVMFCRTCSLAFLREVVDPQILYAKNYPYVTSKSDTMRAHFASLWEEMKKDNYCISSVLEIGSNDGHFLKFCKESGADSVLGIDPAENLKPSAEETGIISICGMFDRVTASIAHTAMPEVDVIVARHVFAHIDDWKGFVKNLDIIAQKETLVVIEVPYVMDMLDKVELDQIYHEHLSFVSLRAIDALLDSSPFHVHHVIHFPIHGGAIVVMIRRNDSERYPDHSREENITESMWQTFSNQAHTALNFLRFKIDDLLGLKGKRTGKTICGFGASAKSSVWISACGFTSREIDFICDCTPNKQGRFSPGTDIPIVPESVLMEKKPDYAILFSWNFADEIISRNKAYLEAGGHFIIPGPRIQIV